MSNYLAVATVTAGLRYIIQQAVGSLGAKVTTLRPNANANQVPEPVVNVYLYQSLPNGTFRNEDLPTRDAAGQLILRPRAAVDLRYLLTFYGDESALMPQLLLGRTLARLHAEAALTPALIRAAIAAETTVDLKGSDLAEQPVLVRVTQAPLDSEELSRLWSIFAQTPYNLSASFVAGPVLLDEPVQLVVPVQVREPQVVVTPFAEPVVERIVYPYGPPGALDLALEGESLAVRDPRAAFTCAGTTTTVRPAVEDVTGARIVIRAGALGFLRYGWLEAQVRGADAGSPPQPQVRSRPALLALRPSLLEIRLDGDVLQVTTALPVSEKQAATAGLRQVAGELSFTLTAEARSTPGNTLRFPAAGVAPGTYLVFVMVDGVASTLDSPVHEVTVP